MDLTREYYPHHRPPPPPPPHHQGIGFGTAALTPNSASTAGSFPSPPGGSHYHHRQHHPSAPPPPGSSGLGAGLRGYRDDSHLDDEDDDARLNGGTPPRKKQKRNKPTLSCQECVERKTKVRDLICTVLKVPSFCSHSLSDVVTLYLFYMLCVCCCPEWRPVA